MVSQLHIYLGIGLDEGYVMSTDIIIYNLIIIVFSSVYALFKRTHNVIGVINHERSHEDIHPTSISDSTTTDKDNILQAAEVINQKLLS